MLSCRRSAAIALAATAASVLIPWTADDVERNAALDIELVRSGKVEYKGIEATFEELSRAYALAISSEAEFLGWSAIPNPTHPEAEALVSCRFLVAGVTAGTSPAGADAPQVGHRAVPLDVTWRLNTLAGIGIAAHDDDAHDAISNFRTTVEDFLDRLVLVGREDAFLRSGPGPGHAVVDTLDPGTPMLREETAGEWTRVKPAGSGIRGTTAASGWLRSEHLGLLPDID